MHPWIYVKTKNPSRKSYTRLLAACKQAREAIASLDDDALGIASGTGRDGEEICWPVRDELLSKLDEAIAQAE